MMQTTISYLNVFQFLFSRQWVSVTHLQLLLEASQGSEVSNAICGDAPEHLHHVSALSNPCHVKLIKNLSEPQFMQLTCL
jgi:galactose-1-phosphate uridylyltransferase